MIDYLHVYIKIPIHHNSFNEMLWKKGTTDDGNSFYWHNCNDVKIRYYPHNHHLNIKGRLIRLLHNTWVLNPDDLYADETQLFINQINAKLNSLFTSPMLDIRDFTVTRLDYCFNVHTEYVKEYIDFLNQAFRMTNRNMRKNYPEEKQLYGSVYIKTNRDYDQNERSNYVLNFYDKLDWAYNQIAENRYISPDDLEYARNILRLEVQCGHIFLKIFCKKNNIGQTFGELFRYDLALQAEEEIYGRIFRCDGTQDFYTYEAAKKLMPRSEAAKKVLLLAATNHEITDKKYTHGRKRVQQTGVYPYCFLPKGSKPNMLENPMKLIRKKLKDMGVMEQASEVDLKQA